MYSPMPEALVKGTKKNGALLIAPKYPESASDVFIPHTMKYMPDVYHKTEGETFKVAEFYVTYDSWPNHSIEIDQVRLAKDLMEEEKAIQVMFLEFLVERLLLFAEMQLSGRAEIIEIESKHPDIAEVLLDNKFELSYDGTYYKGKRNVHLNVKKAKTAG